MIDFIKSIFSDTYTDGKGYLRYKDSGRLVHRAVAEKKLGRKLRNTEVVHHIDRDKKNNRKENLWVFKDQASHNRAHRYDAKRYGSRASYQGKKNTNKSFI